MNIHIGIEDTSDYYLKAQKKYRECLFYSTFEEIGIFDERRV